MAVLSRAAVALTLEQEQDIGCDMAGEVAVLALLGDGSAISRGHTRFWK